MRNELSSVHEGHEMGFYHVVAAGAVLAALSESPRSVGDSDLCWCLAGCHGSLARTETPLGDRLRCDRSAFQSRRASCPYSKDFLLTGIGVPRGVSTLVDSIDGESSRPQARDHQQEQANPVAVSVGSNRGVLCAIEFFDSTFTRSAMLAA